MLHETTEFTTSTSPPGQGGIEMLMVSHFFATTGTFQPGTEQTNDIDPGGGAII
jgi:hypothetical protein